MVDSDEDLAGIDIKASYLVCVRYLSNGENDEEIHSARKKAREEAGNVGKAKNKKIPLVPLAEASDEEADPLEHILKKKEAVGLEIEAVDEEPNADGDCYDSDDFGSLVGSDEKDDRDDAQRRKSRYVRYNQNEKCPKFKCGMVFLDKIQFGEAIRKYSVNYRRELKFIKNEPARILVQMLSFCQVSMENLCKL